MKNANYKYKKMKRTLILSMLLYVVRLLSSRPVNREMEKSPTSLVIFADDLGYGDLGVFGHPYHTIPLPWINWPLKDKNGPTSMWLLRFAHPVAPDL